MMERLEDRGLWTRIRRAAEAEGMTLEEFVAMSDRDILALPNMGKGSLKVLRERYPAPPPRETPIDALRALVAKLEAIIAHPSYKAVFAIAMLHGQPYDGPDYAEELKRAKAALGG